MRSFLSTWMVMGSLAATRALSGCGPDPRPRVLTGPCDSENTCESKLT